MLFERSTFYLTPYVNIIYMDYARLADSPCKHSQITLTEALLLFFKLCTYYFTVTSPHTQTPFVMCTFLEIWHVRASSFAASADRITINTANCLTQIVKLLFNGTRASTLLTSLRVCIRDTTDEEL